MANRKIQTTELDFDEIKTNLKTFLQGQEQFQDYDFEGSAMSVLLDVLAYNTHYNALYTNLAVNESFLDSASKRSSVVSRAKELGYIPRSATGAHATIDISVTQTSSTPTVLTLPAYSKFTTSVDGTQYSFYTMAAYTAIISNNTYTFNNVLIREGTPLTYSYTVTDGVKYVIPNNNVDLSTLTVRVQDSASSTTFSTFVNQEDILSLDSTSKVYFIKEIEGEFHELEFGNDVIGKALQFGNIVTITYMTTAKASANGARLFSYQGASLIGGIVSTVTTSAATGGSDIEDIETIRYNAPRAYTAQNRAVTVEDYRTLIYRLFPEAQAVNIWGGEDNIPPQYGKVYISIKPKTTDELTDSQKTFIVDQILKQKNVVSITPEIINPSYINLQLDVSVYYNPKLTNKSESDIKNLVIQTIQNYNATNLNSFSGIFKFSNLTSLIDSTEESITSNIMTIKLGVGQTPAYGIPATYNIELGNPIYGSGVPEQSILTTGFYVFGSTEIMYLEDLPLNSTFGLIRQFYNDSTGNKVYVRTFGTAESPAVNYPKGSIIIEGLYLTGLDFTTTTGDAGQWIIKPQSNDVVSVRNQLVTIQDNKINVTMIVDKLATGDSAGGRNHIFTSSRN
jgi:hypothetical protein